MRVFEEIRRSDLTREENEELSQFTIDLVSKYVYAEHRFLDLVFEMSDQEGMTLQEAKDYINYLGALRLAQVGLMDWSEVPENTLPWIDYILSGSKHTNFFENKVVDYSHNGLAGSVDYSQFKEILEDRVFG
jgi:ribonucleoside-diphosphate reductase beta chain